MLKFFQRAFARAGIKIKHSQGFNPHPKLSLPLPRPVGVESDDELLCVQIVSDPNESQIKTGLSAQLTNGCELLSASFAQTDYPQPSSATYIIPIQQEYLNDKLKAMIDHLLASESLILERRRDTKDSKLKTQNLKLKSVDVRPFLESIELDNQNIVIVCKITPAGSVRVEEILRLLEIDTEKLTAPIKRTNVQWQKA